MNTTKLPNGSYRHNGRIIRKMNSAPGGRRATQYWGVRKEDAATGLPELDFHFFSTLALAKAHIDSTR